MKGVKTPTQFIEWMWKNGRFKISWDIDNIIKLGKSYGYTFTKDAIRMALNRADFITQSGKVKGNLAYSQTHPPTEYDETEIVEDHIRIFELLDLHPEIKQACSKLFHDGHYHEAIFAAFKKINNMVKKKSGLSNKDGKDLMLTSFSPNKPVLKINKLKTTSDENEQEGFMHIFAGSMHGIRNPRGHDDKIYDAPKTAIEYICLASLLAKRIDKTHK